MDKAKNLGNSIADVVFKSSSVFCYIIDVFRYSVCLTYTNGLTIIDGMEIYHCNSFRCPDFRQLQLDQCYVTRSSVATFCVIRPPNGN